MNLVEVAGHLGDDPEERFTSGGKRVITLRVAARTRANGQDETIWWNVNIWNDRYDKMLPFLKKGSSVIIIGDMSKPTHYTSKKDGSIQISLNMTAEIIKFSPFGRHDRPEAAGGDAFSSNKNNYSQQYVAPVAAASGSLGSSVYEPEGAFAGDDLPF